jgi:hypothetical protein
MNLTLFGEKSYFTSESYKEKARILQEKEELADSMLLFKRAGALIHDKFENTLIEVFHWIDEAYFLQQMKDDDSTLTLFENIMNVIVAQDSLGTLLEIFLYILKVNYHIGKSEHDEADKIFKRTDEILE